MQGTPNSNRAHVVILGETNSGKSSLFNALTGSDISIVSGLAGTTTDPVQKAMELIPFGPVVFVDTAGLNDSTELGRQRMAKSKKMLDRADYVLYVLDPAQFEPEVYLAARKELEARKVPHTLVLSKFDREGAKKEDKGLPDEARRNFLAEHAGEALRISSRNPAEVERLRGHLAQALKRAVVEREGLVRGLLPSGGLALLVVPLDSAAPKGRLILPQVQVIRDCLDNGARCMAVTPDQVAASCAEGNIDLVITDSQVFAEVAALIPPDMPLTSFSILLARQKGNISVLANGAAAIKNLKDGDRVLLAEVCTHNKTHEDIGQVKIPAALRKITGKKLEFEQVTGRDFPEQLKDYALIIHCGACMITPTEMCGRLGKAGLAGVPMTNYGVALAYCGGILERALKPLGI